MHPRDVLLWVRKTLVAAGIPVAEIEQQTLHDEVTLDIRVSRGTLATLVEPTGMEIVVTYYPPTLWQRIKEKLNGLR